MTLYAVTTTTHDGDVLMLTDVTYTDINEASEYAVACGKPFEIVELKEID